MMTELIPAPKQQGVEYLVALTRDPEADPARRDKAAHTLAQIYIPSAKSNTAADLVPTAAARDGGAKPPAATNGQDIPQCTMSEAIGVVLDMSERALAEVRHLKAVCSTLQTALDAQRRETAELKAELARCLKDGGTWNAERAFKQGDVTTYRGQPWVCQKANSGTRPGTDSSWRLQKKREHCE